MNVHIVSTLTDDELDAVSAGASFTLSFNSNQLGNTNSTGNLTVTLNQGQTGQSSNVTGTFTTT